MRERLSSEELLGAFSPEAIETNKDAYERLHDLVAARLEQLPPEVMDKLQAVVFTLGSDDLPDDQGRTRVHTIRIEPEEEAENLRISIRNPLYGRDGLFDLAANGGRYDRPGMNVWDETKRDYVPRATTPAYFGSEEFISRLDAYMPVLERLPATAELELSGVTNAQPVAS